MLMFKKIWNEILSLFLGDKCENCGKRTHKITLQGYEPNRIWVCLKCDEEIKKENRKSRPPMDGWTKWAREHGSYGYGR